MNRQEMQSKLDHAAKKLDGKGYRDLADRVDAYNEKLMASKTRKEVDGIREVLVRVNREATRRDEIDYTKPEEKKTSRLDELRQRRKAREEQKKLDERKEARKAALERLKKRREAKKEEKEEKETSENLRLARLKRLRKQRDEKIWDDD
jgi:hypothetical protein